MSITAERKTALIKEHARGKGDTGSPEVQVAILTERINNLTQHFKSHAKDNHSPSRPADDGQQAPFAARLPPWQGRAALHRPDREARPPQISFRSGPPLGRFAYLKSRNSAGRQWGRSSAPNRSGPASLQLLTRLASGRRAEGTKMFNIENCRNRSWRQDPQARNGPRCPPGRWRRPRDPGRNRGPLRGHRRQDRQAGPGLLPADRPLPGKILGRRAHPGRLLQARARRDRKGNADQPPDRPPDPPAVPRRLLQ